MREDYNATPPSLEARGYETADLRPRAVVTFLIGFAMAAIAFQIGLYYLQRYLIAQDSPRLSLPYHLPNKTSLVQPQLQPSRGHSNNDWQDWHDLRTAQERQLNAYGAIPEDAQHAHIPIDRAMKLYLRKRALTAPATNTGDGR
jgi:hypothetical protein